MTAGWGYRIRAAVSREVGPDLSNAGEQGGESAVARCSPSDEDVAGHGRSIRLPPMPTGRRPGAASRLRFPRPGHDGTSRSPPYWPCGALLRMIAMLGYRPASWFNDSFDYLHVAMSPYPHPIRPDGYSFLLWLLKPFHSFALVTGLQHLMGLAGAVMIYAVLRKRFRLPGWGAALATAPLLFDALPDPARAPDPVRRAVRVPARLGGHAAAVVRQGAHLEGRRGRRAAARPRHADPHGRRAGRWSPSSSTA